MKTWQFAALENWIRTEAAVMVTANSSGPRVLKIKKRRDEAREIARQMLVD